MKKIAQKLYETYFSLFQAGIDEEPMNFEVFRYFPSLLKKVIL